MDFSERLYRAHLTAAWRTYRSTRHLPLSHAWARKEVRHWIAALRELMASRGTNTHRPAEWAGVYSRMAA